YLFIALPYEFRLRLRGNDNLACLRRKGAKLSAAGDNDRPAAWIIAISRDTSGSTSGFDITLWSRPKDQTKVGSTATPRAASTSMIAVVICDPSKAGRSVWPAASKARSASRRIELSLVIAITGCSDNARQAIWRAFDSGDALLQNTISASLASNWRSRPFS